MMAIAELEKELIDLVSELDDFTTPGFSMYNIDDLESKISTQGARYPFVGVGYNGCEPFVKQQPGGVPASASASAVAMLDLQFIVVVAIQYGYNGVDETKPVAFKLLDSIRAKVLGYQKVNTRPWRFIAERPEPEASGDGVAFYSQVWQTVVPSTGIFNQS